MKASLSKTDFILYRECPKNVWVKWHKPEVYAEFPVSEFELSLGKMGNEVEEVARRMFPEGVLISGRGETAQKKTRGLIKDKSPIIFQAVFETDKYITATDVLKWNEGSGMYDLYEIKMSSTEEEDSEGNKKINKKKETQFEYDLAFQVNALEESGVKLNKKYLIRLNKDYVRIGELNYVEGELFIIEDKTEVIDGILDGVKAEMETAYDYLSTNREPVGPCSCFTKGRSAHCTTFSYSNPDVPEYSVHDLNRIGQSKKYLTELVDSGILHIKDVPIDDRLKNKKLNQVLVHKSGEAKFPNGVESLKEELDKLVFPLYFLDYETSPTAIPLYNGYKPYQHIVFQYSLHILREPDAVPEHIEELILDGDPAERIAESLHKNIGNSGTIVSWYATFENSRNKELGRMFPKYQKFFDDLVGRTYDLMKIVEDQHYIHPEFYGRSSIKKVLPALIKDLSYKNLGVQSGTDAIEAYKQITSGKLKEKEVMKKRKDMLEYCKLDTLAMYRLWKFFRELV